MVLLAELATYGVSLERAEPMPGPTEQRYRAIAREHGLWLVPGSLYERAGDRDLQHGARDRSRRERSSPGTARSIRSTPYESDVACGDAHTVFDIPDVGRIRRLDLLRHVVPGDDAARSPGWAPR